MNLLQVKSGPVDDKRLFVKGKSNILVQTKKEQSAFLVFFMFRDLNIIFLVSLSFYFEDFMFISIRYVEIKDKHDTLITKVKMTQSKIFSLKLSSQIDSCMHTTI